jgi:hypothetical protein
MKGPEDDPECSLSRPGMDFLENAANLATVTDFVSDKAREVQQGVEQILDRKVDVKVNETRDNILQYVHATRSEDRKYLDNKLHEFRTEKRRYLDTKFLDAAEYLDNRFMLERRYQDDNFKKLLGQLDAQDD